jgi:hypothetical protein
MKPIFRPCVLVLILWITAATFAGNPDARTGVSRVDREYCYELLRYLYRWYLDDDLFFENPEIRRATDVEFWIRELVVEADKEDRSRYLEVLLPIIETTIILKKADYRIPELGTAIQNLDYKIATVDRYQTLPAPESEYLKVTCPLDEVVAYLYRTRNQKRFPDDVVRGHLGDALRERMLKESPIEIEGDQLFFLAPFSPVSNELWVFWENQRKIIRFTSDSDYGDAAIWQNRYVGVDIYDLDHDIVISHLEMPGSNAYITKDAVGRILFNCVVLGQRLLITKETIAEKKPESPDNKVKPPTGSK